VRIVIVEDEPPIAREIERSCRSILGERIRRLEIFHSLEDASSFLDKNPIDLCLLDLNLHGQDGYDLLKHAVSRAFQTIVISAYTDQAVRAFEHGVLDFVPKPFSEERLKKAFERYSSIGEKRDLKTRYVVTRRQGKHYPIPLRGISYFKAGGYLVEVHLKSGRTELIEKSLTLLERILPGHFVRIHRSYIVDLDDVTSFEHDGGGVYHVTLKNQTTLPLGRKYLRALKDLLGE
jgi:two-component system response regulator LytT